MVQPDHDVPPRRRRRRRRLSIVLETRFDSSKGPQPFPRGLCSLLCQTTCEDQLSKLFTNAYSLASSQPPVSTAWSLSISVCTSESRLYLQTIEYCARTLHPFDVLTHHRPSIYEISTLNPSIILHLCTRAMLNSGCISLTSPTCPTSPQSIPCNRSNVISQSHRETRIP